MANTELASLSRPTSPAANVRAQKSQLMPMPGSSPGIAYPVRAASASPSSQTNSRQIHSQATLALEQYRMQLYNYALSIERLRCPQYTGSTGNITPWLSPYGTPGVNGHNNHMATLSHTISLFPQSQRIFQAEEPKPQHSYIGLIAMAILSSTELKLVLSDIYQYILDNYPYFRTRGPGWRNSIRHNLSLNDCFIKSGRSANGKGHYWAIHPANMDDFRKGDFRRRKAQRKVRKHMGLSVDDASTDSPSPPPMDLTTPPPTSTQATLQLSALNYPYHQHYIGQFFGRSVVAATASLPHYTDVHREPAIQQIEALPQRLEQHQANLHHSQQQNQQQHQHIAYINSTTTTTIANLYSQTRKRQFDVASLLAPDVQIMDIVEDKGAQTQTQRTVITKVISNQVQKQQTQTIHRELLVDLEEQTGTAVGQSSDVDGDIDVVDASDVECEQEQQQLIQRVFLNDPRIRPTPFNGTGDVDADAEGDMEGSQTTPRSLGSSCSQQDSLEEGSLGAAAPSQSNSSCIERSQLSAQTTPTPLTMVVPMNPHLLSRYYGTYMAAAAARRVTLEATRAKSITPPLAIELSPHHQHSSSSD